MQRALIVNLDGNSIVLVTGYLIGVLERGLLVWVVVRYQ